MKYQQLSKHATSGLVRVSSTSTPALFGNRISVNFELASLPFFCLCPLLHVSVFGFFGFWIFAFVWLSKQMVNGGGELRGDRGSQID